MKTPVAPFEGKKNSYGVSCLYWNEDVSKDEFYKAILEENDGEFPPIWLNVLGEKEAAAIKKRLLTK